MTCITTLTFPIYIRSISVLMFSINLGFLTITMRPERRQTIVIMSLCWNYRVTFKSNACNQLKISLHPQVEWIATGFCSFYTHLTLTLKITASVFTCVSRVEFVLFMIIIYAGCSNINIHKILLSCNWATRKIKMKQRSLLMLNENKIQEYFDIVHLCKIFLR